MKKYYILLMLLVGLIRVEAKKIEGQIFYEEDTVSVTLNIPTKLLSKELDLEGLQEKIKYFDDSGKKKTLRPRDAREVRFKFNGKEVRMISITNSAKIRSSFLKLEIDGPVRLFTYIKPEMPGSYDTATGTRNGSAGPEEKDVLQKGDGIIRIISSWTFKKDMTKFFKDCPELAKKIKDKVWRKRDLNQIVNYYNTSCAKK